jgi:hypothetical protein
MDPTSLDSYCRLAAVLQLSDRFWAYKMARKPRGLAGTHNLGLIGGLVNRRKKQNNQELIFDPSIVLYRLPSLRYVASALAEHRDHSQPSVGNLQGMCVIWWC